MNKGISRRDVLLLTAALPTLSWSADKLKTVTATWRQIPASGEALPVIGLGTSRTLDVDLDSDMRARLRGLMTTFLRGGGTLVDSSPMYGRAEQGFGDITRDIPDRDNFFTETKVWTTGRDEGVQQMQASMNKMAVDKVDLMQIHNLVDWRTQIKTLREWKERGTIRYIGITTSHQRAHEEFEQIMKTESLDFVQFSYNIADRVAEQRLLPLAADRGIATLINRPFQRGNLFRRAGKHALPSLATDLQCNSWGQFFLKYILGHPAATCVIPATNKLHHLEDNLGAGYGPLPNQSQRREMLAIFDGL
jgi:diketogulonate reductase-like aldo/keto reductase